MQRESIETRIKKTKSILKTLILLAEDERFALKLLRCSSCGQYWQTGREWNFENREYAFQVPKIALEEWHKEKYTQPASWMIYSVMMRNYFDQNTFEDSENPCRVDGCLSQAVKFSGVCQQHHIEQLQRVGLLPNKPSGRLFAPYL